MGLSEVDALSGKNSDALLEFIKMMNEIGYAN